MPVDSALMSMQVRALFTHTAESRIVLVNEPDNAVTRAPRMLLGRTRASNVWRFRADLSEDLIKALESLCADEPLLTTAFSAPPRHAERYVQLLETHAPVTSVSAGPAYYFPDTIARSSQVVVITENNVELLQGGFEELIAELPAWQPFVARIEQGRAVSVCRSVRMTPEAHEAGVETLAEFRGNGYAADVVAAWSHRVRAIGVIPLYSTAWHNNASQGVARKLGLQCYGADFQIM